MSAYADTAVTTVTEQQTTTAAVLTRKTITAISDQQPRVLTRSAIADEYADEARHRITRIGRRDPHRSGWAAPTIGGTHGGRRPTPHRSHRGPKDVVGEAYSERAAAKTRRHARQFDGAARQCCTRRTCSRVVQIIESGPYGRHKSDGGAQRDRDTGTFRCDPQCGCRWRRAHLGSNTRSNEQCRRDRRGHLLLCGNHLSARTSLKTEGVGPSTAYQRRWPRIELCVV